jgi:hypothetical protein
MITRIRQGQLQTFKEGAYKQEPRIQKAIDKLVTFGYGRLEARELAKTICQSLDNHANVQEAIRQQGNSLYNRAGSTQTPYWKGNNAHIRI